MVTLKDVAHSKQLTNPTTGKLDTLPNVVAQVMDDYMQRRDNQDFANKLLIAAAKPPPSDEVMDEYFKTFRNYNTSAYAFHGVIMHLRTNEYLEDGLAKKLADSEGLRQEIDVKLGEARQEIERLKNLVRLLHGDPDKKDDSMTGSVE